MTSPFEDIDNAFSPFYDEEVIVSTKHGEQSIQASVFQSTTDESLSEDTIDTEREILDIVVRTADWEVVSKIKRGSTVYRVKNQKKYKVLSVKEDDAIGIVIQTREFR